MRNLLIDKSLVVNKLTGKARRLAAIAALLLGQVFNTAGGYYLIPILPISRLPATSLAPSATFTVTNTSDSGTGSLRQAILNANLTSGADTINFGIIHIGNAVLTISPLTPLPAITDPVTIDGSTQSGQKEACNVALDHPCIVIDGTNAGSSAVGLDITAGNTTIKGLVINNFGGSGISIFSNGGDTIQGNYIGTDATGATSVPNGVGLRVDSGSNLIGGAIRGAGNLISGNTHDGLEIDITAGSNNTIEGNLIGTNKSGTAALSNDVGVAISAGSGNILGGTTGAAHNLISGNAGDGVWVSSSATGTLVEGNDIGTDGSGAAALHNGIGVLLNSANNTIGGTSAGAGNVISGNTLQGITIATVSATGNTIEGNDIGTSANAAAKVPNGIGVLIETSGNTVGGTSPGARNIISGNFYGVEIVGTGVTGVTVQGNYIGTNAAGNAALPNSDSGILINSATGSAIGGAGIGAGNLISGNKYGIQISGGGSTGIPANVVAGNKIGTTPDGASALPNTVGIFINEMPGVVVGGTTPGAGNLISGNQNQGVFVEGNASGTLIEGNNIGTDSTGKTALPNQTDGVDLNAASQVTVGGAAPGAGNLISGNLGNGVDIENTSSGMVVQGNLIGTDLTGTTALANGTGVGIYDSTQNSVGGAGPGEGNLISGNAGSGVVIQFVNSPTTQNTVQGNTIGLTLDGKSALGNQLNGVFVKAAANTIGGATPGAGNVISANERGVYLAGDSNLVQGNVIGTDIHGSLPLGNAAVGIRIEQANTNTVTANVIVDNDGEGIDIPDSNGNTLQANLIGVTAAGSAMGNAGDGLLLDGASSNNLIGGAVAPLENRIAYNGGNGVTIGDNNQDTPAANTISHNAIYANAKLGIDLGDDGVTPNDAGDGDPGPNLLQNTPVLTGKSISNNTTTITGSLNSLPNTTYVVEFFLNSACDPSGSGEGETFLGSAQVATDPNGNSSIAASFSTILITKPYATATATDPAGNTSEFSNCMMVAPLKVSLPLVMK